MLSMKLSRTSSGVHSIRPFSMPSSKSMILTLNGSALAMFAEISAAASSVIWPPLSL